MTTVTQPRRTMTTAERSREEGGKFRLITGAHLGQGPDGCECDNCTISDDKGKNHVYSEGDVIESREDLCLRYNRGPHSVKYERVIEGQPSAFGGVAPAPASFPLEKMTVPQLLTVAEEEEIDVSKVKSTKEDLLKAIRAATIKGQQGRGG